MVSPQWALAVLCLSAQSSLAAVSAPPAKNPRETQVRNIAVIGAGAAGASTAYHLQRFAEEENIAINVTIFEKSDRIGGRTLTVNAYDDPAQPVELGASIFVSANHILYNAAQRFELPLAQFKTSDPGDMTAIWDGETIVFQSESGASWWWDATRMWWKYGTSPYRAVKLVQNVVNIFLKLYEPPYFPFRSLTQRVYELGLERATGTTGEQFLAENGIDAKFGREVIQAATRVNYASNLGYIHGLETMVSFATDGAMAVDGGNWQIFDKMVKYSGATILKNTTVESIVLEKRHYPSRAKPRYMLSTTNNSASVASFDDVVIATPWQFANMTAGTGVVRHRMESVPYTKLHVTLFTSPFALQPSFFGLEPGSKAPRNVYTTLGPNEKGHQGAEGVGKAGFYSISTLSTATNPGTNATEYLYKIFSAAAVTPEFLERLLGAEIPTEFVGTKSDDAAAVPAISWFHAHWFHSYPIELPRVTFQDAVVNDGVYYTSGIESFISTMETSALMGMNVARLIVNEAAGLNQRVRQQGPKKGSGGRRPPSREDFFDSLESELEGMMMMDEL